MRFLRNIFDSYQAQFFVGKYIIFYRKMRKSVFFNDGYPDSCLFLWGGNMLLKKYSTALIIISLFIIAFLLIFIFIYASADTVDKENFVRLYWPLFSPFISGLLGGALPFFALRWAVRSFRISQDRLSREKAIDVIRSFNSSFTIAVRSANKIAESLNDEQLLALDAGEAFIVNDKWIDILKLALPNAIFPEYITPGKGVSLSAAASFQLRSSVLELLNAVEIVCAAWVYDVSKTEIILEEIRFLYDPSERNSLHERFRHITHSNKHYPNIVKFTNFIKKIDNSNIGNNNIMI
jgi:uncharacterized integral membrane protein